MKILTESRVLGPQLLNHPVECRLGRPVLDVRNRKSCACGDTTDPAADGHELGRVRGCLEERVRCLSEHHRSERVHGEVVLHALDRGLEDRLALADSDVCDHDIQATSDLLDLVNGGMVVGHVGRD
jgi:hypothetical protein